jgi:hypothetical protein
MGKRIYRSIDSPIRENLTWEMRWCGSDDGLIACWERGREMSITDPDLAAKAKAGELPILAWRGGVEAKLKEPKVDGTLKYLAMWQGLREEDLDVHKDEKRTLICRKTGQSVTFEHRELSTPK